MEKFINKINIKKILIIYLLAQPIIDIITSLCVRHVSENLTLGIFVRTLFMIFIVIYSLIVSNKKDRIKSLIYYILLGIYTLIYLFVCYNQNGMAMILTQIKGLIKTLYLPLVLVALLNISKEKDIKIENKYFIWTLLGYTVTMFVARIFGIAYPSYVTGLNLGTVGLFYAANEIGAILGILAPLLFIELFKKIKVINIISAILITFAVLEIGTKVPFISLMALVCIVILIYSIKLFKKENVKEIISKMGIATIYLLVIILLMGYMPIGKNMDINVIETISEKIFNDNENIKNDTNNNKNNNKNKDNTMTETLSGRDTNLTNNLERYKNSSILEKIFGNGYLTTIEGEVQENKTVEMDIFDIIFSLGIIGAILVFLPVIYMIIIIIINIFKNIKKVIFNEEIILLCYSIAIAYGISLLAGHVLVAPAVAIFIILNFVAINDKLKKVNTEE